jgi:hypothetical protein
VEYGFIFRGEDPSMCAIGALSRYFYHRFVVEEEAPLNMVDEDGNPNTEW